MLTFGLENVKAFRNTGDLALAPITLFVGQNSCGKSSLIRFPVVLSQSIDSDFNFSLKLHSNSESSIDYGNFEDVLHNHKGNGFIYKYSYPTMITTDPIFRDKMLPNIIIHSSVTIGTNQRRNRFFIERYEMMIDNRLALLVYRERDMVFRVVQKLAFDNGNLVDIDNSFSVLLPYGIELVESTSMSRVRYLSYYEKAAVGIIKECCDHDGRANVIAKEFLGPNHYWYAPAGYYSVRTPNNAREISLKYGISEKKLNKAWKMYQAYCWICELKDNVNRRFFHEIKGIHYIGPFRSNPERIYRKDEGNISDVGINGELFSSMLINDIDAEKSIIESVSKWFEETFHYSVCVSELGNGYYQIILNDRFTNTDSNIMDVGYGIPQVLPIVTQIAYSSVKAAKRREKSSSMITRNNNSPQKDTYSEIYVIEQPEIHLHPAAQSKLASLFSNALGEQGRENTVFLIETHSEHFIRALQVMIADPDHFMTKEMVKIYYVDRDENGEAFVKEMVINDDGQFIETWPSGFFDKSFELSKDLMRAIAARKSQGKKAEQ